MPEYEIAGIRVSFPYHAYPNQITYMHQVISCLKEGGNAILESPTGTGKTLCLLCATLAYWKQFIPSHINHVLDRNSFDLKNEMIHSVTPKIIYASRTHSQLSQVIAELKKTSYTPKTCILGSRDQLCRNPEVMKLSNNFAKTTRCKDKVKHRKCEYYGKVNEAVKSPMFLESILDIEDLIKLGDNFRACSYYMARESLENADIIFIPYNYLVDPQIRSTQGINLSNSIILLDEAHNLESVCSDAYSFTISATDFDRAVKECVNGMSLPPSLEGFSAASVSPLVDLEGSKDAISKLKHDIEGILYSRSQDKVIRDGSLMLDLLRNAGINHDNFLNHVDSIEECLRRLNEGRQTESIGGGLSAILTIIKVLFNDNEKSHSKNENAGAYKIYIEKNLDIASPHHPKWIMNYWCFDPGLAIEALKSLGALSVILTSGTLAPIDSLARELKIPFKHRLENQHIIQPKQVFLGIVNRGPMGKLLDSSYSNRSSTDYLLDLGSSIVNVTRIVPDGVLVFFPSYTLMNACIDFWQSNRNSANGESIMQSIDRNKTIFIEPKEKVNFTQLLSEYSAISVSSRKGAILFGISRGKVSEGIDFSDAKARAVIIVGLPFPALKDPKIELKKIYLDEQNGKKRTPGNASSGLSSQDWYFHQAIRAVNQAIGRVIRHKNDYGSIILLDHRFAKDDIQRYLPSWVKPSIQVCESFGQLQKGIVVFFKENQQTSQYQKAIVSLASTLTDANFTTKSYLLAIKEALNQEDYAHFTGALLQFSEEKKSDPVPMLHKIYDILIANNLKKNEMSKSTIASSENGSCVTNEPSITTRLDDKAILFKFFKRFLPSKYHSIHQNLIDSHRII